MSYKFKMKVLHSEEVLKEKLHEITCFGERNDLNESIEEQDMTVPRGAPKRQYSIIDELNNSINILQQTDDQDFFLENLIGVSQNNLSFSLRKSLSRGSISLPVLNEVSSNFSDFEKELNNRQIDLDDSEDDSQFEELERIRSFVEPPSTIESPKFKIPLLPVKKRESSAETSQLFGETEWLEESKETNTSECFCCDEEFENQTDRLNHLRKDHIIKKCKHCLKIFPSIWPLAKHFKIHETNKKLKCDFCDRTFNYFQNLKSHLRQHTDEHPFKCDFEDCKDSFKHRASLVNHIRNHKGLRPYKCEFCPNKFTLLSTLKNHFLRRHSNEKSFKCTVCKKGFKDEINLLAHATVHSNERKYECKYCQKTYKYSQSLYYHIREKHEVSDVSFSSVVFSDITVVGSVISL